MVDTSLLTIFCAWLIGGFVANVTGIGGALVSVPIVASVLPMHDLIPVSCVVNVAMSGCVFFSNYRYCQWRAVLPILIGSLPGIVLGILVLKFVSGSTLQIATGFFLLFYVIWQYTKRHSAPHPESWLTASIAGAASGTVGTAISFGGPPAAMYALHVGWNPRQTLGTLGGFFFVKDALTCVAQAYEGFITAQTLHYAAYGVSAAILGAVLAYPLTRFIKVDMFRRLLLGVLLISAVVCIMRGINA